MAAGQNPRRAAAGGDHGPLGAAAACEWEKADRALFDRLACVGESARALPAVASAGKSPTVARAPAEGRVDEMCRRLRHVPAVAGGAHAPSLARKCHDELLRAPRAEIAGESEAEQPAREIPAELLFDVARDWVLACRAICEPAFEALRHDSVERRLLGAAALESGGTPRGRRADAKTAAPETDKKWRPWGNPGRGRVRGRTYTTPGKARCTAGPGAGSRPPSRFVAFHPAAVLPLRYTLLTWPVAIPATDSPCWTRQMKRVLNRNGGIDQVITACCPHAAAARPPWPPANGCGAKSRKEIRCSKDESPLPRGAQPLVRPVW